MTTVPTPPERTLQTYTRALGAFALAQVFPEYHDRLATARQVLIPWALLPPALRDPAPYRTVAAVLDTLGRLASAGSAGGLYDLWEYRMTTTLRRLAAAWPRLLREALFVAHGLAEPVDLEALAAAAAAAEREAAEALAGPA
jgi:hypothetical protein